MLKGILKILGFFAVGIAGGIFASQVLWPYFAGKIYGSTSQPPVYINETKEVTIQENNALENSAKTAQKVIVGVRTVTQSGKVIEGSGLIVTSDGEIVTLADLVPQGSTFYFYINGQAVSYQIIKRDLKDNLALIKISQSNLPTVSFGDSNELNLGESVFLLGDVFENKIPQIYINEGIVSSLATSSIQTNISEKANVQGSTLFDIEGNILGINIIDSNGRVVAIPVSEIENFSGL